MNTPLQDRFRLLADAAGSLRRLDAAAGCAPGHAHAIAEGRIVSPTVDTLRQVANACGVSFGWLAFGEGPAPTPEAVRAAVDAARAAHAFEPIGAPADEPTGPVVTVPPPERPVMLHGSVAQAMGEVDAVHAAAVATGRAA